MNPSAESIGTPVSPKRPRLGFSEVPRKVRWIIYVNAAGGLSFGYLMIFITGYYPEIGIGAGTIGLILGAEGAAMVTFAGNDVGLGQASAESNTDRC